MVLYINFEGGGAVKKRFALFLSAAAFVFSTFLFSGCQSGYLMGDVNGDGAVDFTDVLTLSRYLSGDVFTVDKNNSDMSFDGKITATDLSVLKKYLAGAAMPGNRFSSLSLNGESVESYRLIVPASAGEDSCEYRAASLLARHIEKSCGVSVEIADDTEQEKRWEILIGATSREESKYCFKEFERMKSSPLQYLVCSRGTKIVMLGEGFAVGGGVGYLTHTAFDTAGAWNSEANISVPVQTVLREYSPAQAQNVILIIGDGMGSGAVELYKAANPLCTDDNGILRELSHNGNGNFTAEAFPNLGNAGTSNIKGLVTDSAASATAIATGYKTLNTYLGVIPVDSDGDGTFDGVRSVQNVREYAARRKASTGIISTDRITGATPNAFLVHHSYRYEYSVVRAQQESLGNSTLKCDYLWCDYDSDSLLKRFADAVDLLGENDSGFFLMAEEAMIDKYESKLDYENTVRTVERLDSVVEYAALYAVCHPETAVIVTADHETGGLVSQQNDDGKTVFSFTSGGEHTGSEVAVYAIGPGTEIFAGKTVENTDIARFIFSVFS